jgi:membrane protease subunit (stomatin/prohibitin family)
MKSYKEWLQENEDEHSHDMSKPKHHKDCQCRRCKPLERPCGCKHCEEFDNDKRND